jgi:hypothetical protein
MKASIVDLRYKTREILEALGRNETVSVMYHGKVKGILSPARNESTRSVSDHPFFGMKSGEVLSVEEEMNRLRGARYDL